MKSFFGLLVLAIGLAIMPACTFEEPVDHGPPPQQHRFENLSQMWHVLNNIELSYSRRDLTKYDQLLDDDFTFFVSAGDVGGGLPESWDREVEVQATTNLFSPDQPPAPLKRVLRIQMAIQWYDDHGKSNLAWSDFTPPNSSETWYTTTVKYDFKIDVEGDLTYINSPGSQAQFTVRNAGTVDAPQWRLVEMRDLGDDGIVASSAAMTESTTLGKVKALYR